MNMQGLSTILIGFMLVIIGAVLPFLMVLNMIIANFWLSLLAYSSSVIGLFLGLFGVIQLKQDELDK
jgi:hypothetical protein